MHVDENNKTLKRKKTGSLTSKLYLRSNAKGTKKELNTTLFHDIDRATIVSSLVPTKSCLNFA